MQNYIEKHSNGCGLAIISIATNSFVVFFFSAMFSRFMNTGSQFVMEGVKNLVVGNKVSSGSLLKKCFRST